MADDNSFLIAASILGANWLEFGSALQIVEKAGADILQIDVADGHFAPTITFGEELVRSIRAVSKLPIEVHLMVDNPNDWIPRMAQNGANTIIFHVESVNRLQGTIEFARRNNVCVGIALNTETRVETIEHILNYVDVVTLMAILPGFARQAFIPEAYIKIERLRNMVDKIPNKRPIIEVDGGVKDTNIQKIIAAGADAVVVSSAIFDAETPIDAVKNIRKKGGLITKNSSVREYVERLKN